MTYKYFVKKSKGGGANNELKQSEQSAEELNKPIKKKMKVYSSFKKNICAVDSANMQLISKFNKLCDIDIFSK